MSEFKNQSQKINAAIKKLHQTEINHGKKSLETKERKKLNL